MQIANEMSDRPTRFGHFHIRASHCRTLNQQPQKMHISNEPDHATRPTLAVNLETPYTCELPL
jgi:hypothetical protein